MKWKSILIWLLRVVPAFIMLQTLYFKFTGHEQSVKLFTMLGMEPWGRIGTGILELIAAFCLLLNSTVIIGASLGLGLMAGALFFHFTVLGVEFDGDAGLFIYAVISFICCLCLLIIYRTRLTQWWRTSR